MHSKFYVHTCGGMGDHYLGYFNPNCKKYGLGFIEQLKEEYPNSTVKLIAHPANPQGPEFFRYHPHIDEIETHPWVAGLGNCKNKEKEAKGYIELEEFGKEKEWAKRKNETIYTSEEDDKFLKTILNKKPFVVLHPFASDKQRMPMQPRQFFPLVDSIIKDYGIKVIVLGGSYKRTRNRLDQIKEEFPYEREGLINLIGKTNSRTAAKIIHSSKVLIANHSGLWCAASIGGIKLIAMHRNPEYHSKWIKSIFVDDGASSVVIDVNEKIRKNIIRANIIERLDKILRA